MPKAPIALLRVGAISPKVHERRLKAFFDPDGKPRNQRQISYQRIAGLEIVLQNKMRDCILISAFWAVAVAANGSFAFAGNLILLGMTDAHVGLRA